jgi:hypothetical protein
MAKPEDRYLPSAIRTDSRGQTLGVVSRPGALMEGLPARRTRRPTPRPEGRRSPFWVRPSSGFSAPSSGVGTLGRCLSRIVRGQNSRKPSLFRRIRHGAVETHELARCCGSESVGGRWAVRCSPPRQRLRHSGTRHDNQIVVVDLRCMTFASARRGRTRAIDPSRWPLTADRSHRGARSVSCT